MASTESNSDRGDSSMAMFMDEPAQQEPIRVCLRLRPMNNFELSRRSTHCLSTQEPSGTSAGKIPDKHAKGDTIKINSPLEGEFHFLFDNVLPEDTSQLTVYQQVVAPLATQTLEGFSCALIAYGQTGSGKTYTMMGGYDHVGTKAPKPSKEASAHGEDDTSGMIHRLMKDVFRLIRDSPPSVEYIVRCSFVEIYLEKVLDLLNPVNRSIQIISGELHDVSQHSPSKGVRMHGASEACCFDESDVISLLVRGNACRSVSSTKMNTDSSRSHAIFTMKIEQKDNTTGITKASQLQMIDMAGSELSRKHQAAAGARGATDSAIQHEAQMINKSLSLLNTVVKTVAENQTSSGPPESARDFEVPYRQSKLIHLLQDAIGGNCRTTILLTASPASYNISESIRTMKFGSFCRSVKNFVKPSVDMSPMDYRKILNGSQKKQEDLVKLVNELSAECFQLKQAAKEQTFQESHFEGPLWKKIESILVKGASERVKHVPGSNTSADVTALQEKVLSAQKELEKGRAARGNLENLLAERLSEVAVLRTQHDTYAAEKKKDAQELVSLRNEILLLTQRKQEVEHNLRTSQFREYEATVFLRQFRRFYRRLLRNKAHQGTGRTSDVIERVPGVPDLNDLIDVDSLLLEAGLIEESELHDDTATGAYRPSAQALGRSTDATSKAWEEATSKGKVDELESFDRSTLEGKRHLGSRNADDSGGGADAGAGTSSPHGQLISNRQQFLNTPAGRLTTIRERELERDLLRATERCIELQVALNEEKANVDILTNRAGNLNKKKFAQESIQVKQQLDKKTHDLQAIIWKMNELHLINKTYNEKMSNREQHVTYLEENLVELQSTSRNLALERQDTEGHLRKELDNLKVLVDAMTVPLWQLGECGVTGRTLASRIRLPVCGGDYDMDENENDADSLESMESDEESYEDEEDETEDENESNTPETLATESQIIQQRNVSMRDVSTQTQLSSGEDKVTPQPTYFNSNGLNANQNKLATKQDISMVSTQSKDQVLLSQNSALATTATDGITQLSTDLPNNGYPLSEDYLYYGGKPADSEPRRFVQKYSFMIRPGVLKDSKPKSDKVSSVKI